MKRNSTVDFATNYATHLQHLKLKGLQPKTIDAYSRAIRRVGEYFKQHIDDLSEAQLSVYFIDLLKTRSWTTAKLDLCGLRFYYQHVLKKELPAAGLLKPPKAQRLPDIVTIAEAQRIFAATRVLSYKVFFFTLYSLGLRLGEGLRLTVADLDADRMRVHIRDAKGNKDRLVPLPDATLAALRGFWKLHRHPQLLFPNRSGGLKLAHQAKSPLDRGGVQKTMAKVIAECGLKKRLPRIACATAMLHI